MYVIVSNSQAFSKQGPAGLKKRPLVTGCNCIIHNMWKWDNIRENLFKCERARRLHSDSLRCAGASGLRAPLTNSDASVWIGRALCSVILLIKGKVTSLVFWCSVCGFEETEGTFTGLKVLNSFGRLRGYVMREIIR